MDICEQTNAIGSGRAVALYPNLDGPRMNKVFGIGFHKTGTTTLAQALAHFGYRWCGVRHDLVEPIRRGDLEPVWRVADDHDLVQDNPWPLIYRELDEHYPDSKFILMVRETDRWIRSAMNHFSGRSTPMREWIYGVGDPTGHRELYIEVYERHNREVQEYFADRPDDLLVVNWERGDGRNELCPFLGLEVPDIPMPHANKGQYGEAKASSGRGLRGLLKKK